MKAVRYLVDGTCYLSDVGSARQHCCDEQPRSSVWFDLYSANGHPVDVEGRCRKDWRTSTRVLVLGHD